MPKSTKKKRIVIVGGGYGGVRVALDLVKRSTNADVYLIDPKFHFEYHSTLYHTVTGGSVMQSAISYEDIFSNTPVMRVTDAIVDIDFEGKEIVGRSGSKYRYDELVLALGSESNYFGIPGLEKNTFSFKSVKDALTLRKHLEGLFSNLSEASHEEQAAAGNIMIVGAGATGVEIAGQLVNFMERVAQEADFDPAHITVNIIEAKDRVLPLLSERASRKAEKRLRKLGVNIFLNRTVSRNEIDSLHMKTMEIDTKTVVWTAGVKALGFYAEKLDQDRCNRRGCVKVTKYFEIPGHTNVHVIGDGAESEYGGMAQTADRQGAFLARVLKKKINREKKSTYPQYVAKKPAFAIPIGKNWALFQWGPFLLSGYFGWLFRRLVDLKYYFSILSIGKAYRAFREGSITSRIWVSEPLSTMNRLRPNGKPLQRFTDE